MEPDLPASEVTLGHAPRRREDAVTVELDGEAVVYAEGRLHRLDRIGTLLWQCFDGSGTLHEIVKDLAEELRGDSGSISDDVLRFTQHMGRCGLLHGVKGDP